jgi:CheY-like chemotaxis protein
MNILVIDDEEEIVESIQEILEDIGYTVSTAGNGAEGLERLNSAPENGFGLILLDLMMPVMDGERFLEALSERGKDSKTPVIVMTASQRIPTSVLPVQILRKPIELDYLLKMVDGIGAK